MAFRQSSLAGSRNAYIPPHIAQAMTQQMQRTMPPHLQQYLGPNRPAYIPQHVERAIAQQMQKTMPPHLKQYASAYMEQRVIEPSRAAYGAPEQAAHTPPHLPPPDLSRLDHSISGAGQYSADVERLPQAQTEFQPDGGALEQRQPSAAPVATNPSSQAYPAAPIAEPQNPYEFLTAPAPPARRSLPGLGPNSPVAQRLLIIVGGLAVVVIVLGVLASSLFGGGNTNIKGLTLAAQQQAEIARVSQFGAQQAVSQNVKNFAASTQLSILSDQQQLITFLQKNGQKISPKQLGLAQNPKTDAALTTAQAASTYDETFTAIVQNQLKSYGQNLKQTFAISKSPSERQILKNDYAHAQLLVAELKSPD